MKIIFKLAFIGLLGINSFVAHASDRCENGVKVEVESTCLISEPTCKRMQSYTNSDVMGYSAWYTLRVNKVAINPQGQIQHFTVERTERILAGNVPSKTYPETPETWSKLKEICMGGVDLLLTTQKLCP